MHVMRKIRFCPFQGWGRRPRSNVAAKANEVLRVCVCVHPWTKGFPPPLLTGRGVWHSRPTTRNEAVGESGKQGLISPAYLPFYQAVTPLFLCFAVMVVP